MIFLTKNKLKLSLIDDYTRIVLIENFYNNSFEHFNLDEETIKLINKTKEDNQQLKLKYENIISYLKMEDISFLVLKKDLKQNNHMYKKACTKSFLNLLEVFERNNLELNLIELNLKHKLKKLKISNLA